MIENHKKSSIWISDLIFHWNHGNLSFYDGFQWFIYLFYRYLKIWKSIHDPIKRGGPRTTTKSRMRANKRMKWWDTPTHYLSKTTTLKGHEWNKYIIGESRQIIENIRIWHMIGKWQQTDDIHEIFITTWIIFHSYNHGKPLKVSHRSVFNNI